MNITEIARLHGFSVSKVTGGGIDGLVNDLVTGGVDKGLTAEQGKVLNQKKILEYGGFLEGIIDFDNLTPNRLYKIGLVDKTSTGCPSVDISANYGAYSEMEFYDTEGYQMQRIVQVVGGKSMMFRSRDKSANNGAWGSWQRVQTINTNFPTKHVENLGEYVARKTFPVIEWVNDESSSEVCEILIAPSTAALSGVFELNLSSTFAFGDATGGAKIRYSIIASDKMIHNQYMSIEDITPSFASQFYVSNISVSEYWFYITIAKRKRKSPVTVMLSYQSSHHKHAFDVMSKVVLNVYATTTDLSGYPLQRPTFNNDVKIKKNIPDFMMETADGKRSMAIRLNANEAVDYGLDFWKDQNVFMRAMGQNDVQFYDPASGWFTIQSLKQSVSNGKANVAQAITDVGWQTSPTATFDEMASNIRRLGTVKEAKGTAHATAGYIEVRGIGFKPKSIQVKAEGVSDPKMGNASWIGDAYIDGWSDVSMYVSSWDRNSIQSDVVLYDDGFRMRVDDTNRGGAFGWYAVGKNI